MRDWSIHNKLDNWSIKIYLDTNILMYLTDNSHTGLQYAVDYLASSPDFVELISSQYALFEFLENRKMIHYKKHLQNNAGSSTSVILSKINKILKPLGIAITRTKSLGKNYYSFNVRGFSYLTVQKPIQLLVEKEIEDIKGNFKIKYEDNEFNAYLFQPTKDLCLSSRLSRQDCLITTSAIFPNAPMPTKDIIIWTADEDFYKSYYECSPETTDIILKSAKPRIEWTNNLTCIGNNGKAQQLNVEKQINESKVKDFIKNKVIEYIYNKNIDRFIGKTETASKPTDIFYLQTEENVPINYSPDGYYLTVLGRDLDFLIASKKIQSFWLDGHQLKEADFPINSNSVISAKWEHRDSTTAAHKQEISAALKEKGHLVFLSEEQ